MQISEQPIQYYAHSGNPRDKGDWQSLQEHSLAVADLSVLRARPFGLERAARLAGLLHDLGKYTTAFQRRLEGATKAVDHSTAGAAVVLQLAEGASIQDRLVAELVAYAILGHHAGLPNRIGERGFEDRVDAFTADEKRAPDAVWREELAVDAGGLFPPGFRPAADNKDRYFQLAFMGRMIFSCLVDADFRDTEEFYAKFEGIQKDRVWPALKDALPSLIARFDAQMATFDAMKNNLNALRAEILAHVRAKAIEGPGLFTLTVPTGGGKTLASLGFALDHAKAHGHRRIIYAIPFTSIIDQTAKIFCDWLGEDYVLEHHFAIDEDKQKDRERLTSRDKLKLAMEDWAAPIVVTTNVQLFESLFAAKTSRARKLHNITGSVIILDEAQTIPRQLLKPCLRVLDELALNYGCSIVLCTATQPGVDATQLDGGLPLTGRELAPDPQRLSQALRRANIVRASAMTNADLVSAMRDHPQALVIVNSRKHALDLYRDAKAAGLDGLVHLTTRQCAAHRRIILDDLKERLDPNTPLADRPPCRVIATSLIEAGVDVDFPRVWRAEAGLDQIVQAAGRCNREGRRPRHESIVTIFHAPDYPPPSEIRSVVEDMGRVTASDLMSLEAMEQFFAEVYWKMGDRLDAKKILGMFGMGGSARTSFAYRDAAQEFRMIESGMEPVIVPFDPQAVDCVKKLREPEISSGHLARKLQTYVVQVPPKARALLVSSGHVTFEAQNLRGDQFAVLQTESLYKRDADDAVGLLWEEAEYLAKEDAMI